VIEECGIEAAGIGKRHRTFGQPMHGLLEPLVLTETHLGDALVEPAGNVDQHFHQESHRASGGPDVGHEQHGVAGGLVDLNPVAVHQLLTFERVSVITGASDGQGDER
jgi:hypothetical protein